ncbi:hypothetical protein [Geofilum rubicundum]|uniref:Monofunctional biosynthetic peptidoglycan transglycosylase n=1 Tax=Geofilum rubicundum JCM 15548 TaxID=1236989 RepID=A0A0E9LXA7_9BACT|nr:hypothetical protein [Geofilum rubicundum]GAO29869.1 monofunctional biosynthetic peptidoglycan transglycosylase [Geofilum rubicundum JCM 15548]
MLNLLQGVVNTGTAIRLRLTYNLRGQIGGKTGTTQNNSDGWFIGVSPNLVTGVWVGGEDRDVHFDNTYLGQGANMALPIWALYMIPAYEDPESGYSLEDEFEAPLRFDIDLNCPDEYVPQSEDEIEIETIGEQQRNEFL